MSTVEYPGNAIPAPGYARGGQTIDQELLYSMIGYVQKGVTLKPGQGVLLLGTLIKKDTATKQYVKTGASDAEGFLRMSVDTGTNPQGQVWQGNILFAGLLNLGLVQTANSGVTLTNVLGGTVNNVAGFFKF